MPERAGPRRSPRSRSNSPPAATFSSGPSARAVEASKRASGLLASQRRVQSRMDFMASNEKVSCLAGGSCDCEEKGIRALKEVFCKDEQWHCFGVFIGKSVC